MWETNYSAKGEHLWHHSWSRGPNVQLSHMVRRNNFEGSSYSMTTPQVVHINLLLSNLQFALESPTQSLSSFTFAVTILVRNYLNLVFHQKSNSTSFSRSKIWAMSKVYCPYILYASQLVWFDETSYNNERSHQNIWLLYSNNTILSPRHYERELSMCHCSHDYY